MTDPDPNFTPSQEHNACSNAPSATISRNSPPLRSTHAIQRAKAELRRAKRTRSRKLYFLWSEVLAHFDPDTADNTNPRK
jgi:hypothetical protein